MNENKYYTNFKKWLDQGSYYHGSRQIEDPGESFFQDYNPVSKDEYQKFTAKWVDNSGDWEWSGPVSQIWEFTFEAYEEYWPSKKSVPEKKVLIEFYGHYRSHDGSYYEGYREVKPKEITKVVYE